MTPNPVTSTIVVNFFGGPGCGKSTTTAHVFAMMKWEGNDCEMVREYAKDTVWEGTEAILNDQIFVFANQLHRQIVLEDKVPVVLTDSPIILSILYDESKNAVLKELVLQQFHRNHNINFLLKRRKKYVKNGRMQTHEQAIEKDNQLRAILDENNIEYIEIDGVTESAAEIVGIIKQKMEELGNDSE